MKLHQTARHQYHPSHHLFHPNHRWLSLTAHQHTKECLLAIELHQHHQVIILKMLSISQIKLKSRVPFDLKILENEAKNLSVFDDVKDTQSQQVWTARCCLSIILMQHLLQVQNLPSVHLLLGLLAISADVEGAHFYR